ncbi:hypothetical protein B9Z19DRAFT_1083657, partial [Tuber borchii]
MFGIFSLLVAALVFLYCGFGVFFGFGDLICFLFFIFNFSIVGLKRRVGYQQVS